MLENSGFKVTLSALDIQYADARYKGCVDRKDIGSNPKPGEKLTEGSPVIIWYITQEIIEESKKTVWGNPKSASEMRKHEDCMIGVRWYEFQED